MADSLSTTEEVTSQSTDDTLTTTVNPSTTTSSSSVEIEKQAQRREAAELSALLSEVTDLQRKSAIESILNAITVNPLEILQLPLNFNDQHIKDQYKLLSRLVHPDRVSMDLKETAQTAFAKLAEAKKTISDVTFQKQFRVKIIKARNLAEEKYAALLKNQSIKAHSSSDSTSSYSVSVSSSVASKRKLSDMKDTDDVTDGDTSSTNNHSQSVSKNDDVNSVTNSSSSSVTAVPDTLNTSSTSSSVSVKSDGTNDQTVMDHSICRVSDDLVKKELREILIDEAWDARIEAKALSRLQQQQNEVRERMKTEIAQKKQRHKDLIESRGTRVANWRSFQGKPKKKKKKKSSVL